MRPIRNAFNVPEETSFLYHALLTEEDGFTLLPGSTLTSLVLTLYVVGAGGAQTIVNGRNAQNVLNANGVTLYDALQTDAAGHEYNVLWEATPADTVILNDALKTEQHIALWAWTWDAGTKAGKQETVFVVKNLLRVP